VLCHRRSFAVVLLISSVVMPEACLRNAGINTEFVLLKPCRSPCKLSAVLWSDCCVINVCVCVCVAGSDRQEFLWQGLQSWTQQRHLTVRVSNSLKPHTRTHTLKGPVCPKSWILSSFTYLFCFLWNKQLAWNECQLYLSPKSQHTP